MSWWYSDSMPQRCDFDSEEEWQNAMDSYECMEDMYTEEYLERKRGYDY